MATVGKLSAILSLNSAAFSKGLRRASKSAHRFGSNLTRHMRTISMYGGALAAVATGGGIVLLIKKSIDLMDETGKLADRIGDTTEAISALQYAAGQTGSSADEMNKELEQLGKRLGETQMGTGEAKDALEMLGLSAQSLMAMRPSEAFALLADRTAQLGTQSEKTAVATKLFGRSAINLVNTLSLGSRGLEEMRARAEKLGITFDYAAAVKAAMAKDAIDDLTKAMQGLGIAIANQLTPFIKAAADQMTDMATSGEGMGPKVVNAFESVASAAAIVTKTADRILFAWNTLGETATWLGSVLVAPFALFSDTAHEIFVNLATEAAWASKNAKDAFDRLAADEYGTKVAAQFDAIRKAANEAAAAIAATRGDRTGGGMPGPSMSATDDLAKRAKSIFEATRTPMEEYRAKQQEIWDLQWDGLLDAETAMRALQKAKEDLWKDTGAMDWFKDVMTPVEQLEEKLNKLKGLWEAGLISADLYARGLAKLGEDVEQEGGMGGSAEQVRRQYALMAGEAPAGIAKAGGKDRTPVKADPEELELMRRLVAAAESGLAGRATIGRA